MMIVTISVSKKSSDTEPRVELVELPIKVMLFRMVHFG